MSTFQTDNAIKNRLIRIINGLLNSNYIDIPKDKPLGEIGLHSLLTFKLITEIESNFKITIDMEDLQIEKFSNLSEITELLNKYKR
ncbi:MULTISPECIES: acyl carrier protein [Bacillus]|uniref:acyl carrier protein n=1 Tax=Bacillus TaxID=1386 RepID=UPI0020CE0CA6|nr:acyl carrier protein [Bacillus safensis]MCP9282879.1 acyl carrier protein [Bacillus safensis]